MPQEGWKEGRKGGKEGKGGGGGQQKGDGFVEVRTTIQEGWKGGRERGKEGTNSRVLLLPFPTELHSSLSFLPT
jgi:hypothetical protein